MEMSVQWRIFVRRLATCRFHAASISSALYSPWFIVMTGPDTSCRLSVRNRRNSAVKLTNLHVNHMILFPNRKANPGPTLEQREPQFMTVCGVSLHLTREQSEVPHIMPKAIQLLTGERS